MSWLMASCEASLTVVDAEITAFIETMAASGDLATHLNGLRFAMWLDQGLYGRSERGPDLPRGHRLSRFWANRSKAIRDTYQQEITAAATQHVDIRNSALSCDIITVAQALEMQDGLLPPLQSQPVCVFGFFWAAYLTSSFANLVRYSRLPDLITKMTAVGQYLTLHSQLPWIPGKASSWRWSNFPAEADTPESFTPIA